MGNPGRDLPPVWKQASPCLLPSYAQDSFEILLWCVAGLILLDISLSVAAALHIRKDMPSTIRVQQKIAVFTYRFGLAIVGYVERRMKKAYPIIMEKAEPIYRKANLRKAAVFTSFSGSL